METVAAFFGGNPFATPIGQRIGKQLVESRIRIINYHVICHNVYFSKIERATDATMSDEDWALNMEICDLVNEQDDGPRDAVRAIKKRLQMNAGKNHAVVMHSLIVQ